jgi:Cyclin, N-terminal domain
MEAMMREEATPTAEEVHKYCCPSSSPSPQEEVVGQLSVRDHEATVDHLQILMLSETHAYPPCPDYLAAFRSSCISPADRVSEAWRRKLCEWCYEVVDHFAFDREVVSIALNYLDRVVSLKTASGNNEPIPKREYQLLAVTSLYIAIKVHGENESTDSPRRKLKIDAFVELSRGYFQVEVIEATERSMLKALHWRVNPPTVLRFVTFLLRLVPRWATHSSSSGSPPSGSPSPQGNAVGSIFDVARYLAELSVCVSAFSFNCDPSVIAYASILCAMDVCQRTVPIPHEVRVAFLNNVAEATNLMPEALEIRRVREMLMEICPDMFAGDGEVPAEFLYGEQEVTHSNYSNQFSQPGDGKTSPVCVVDGSQDSPRTRRKRSRSANNGSNSATSAVIAA